MAVEHEDWLDASQPQTVDLLDHEAERASEVLVQDDSVGVVDDRLVQPLEGVDAERGSAPMGGEGAVQLEPRPQQRQQARRAHGRRHGQHKRPQAGAMWRGGC